MKHKTHTRVNSTVHTAVAALRPEVRSYYRAYTDKRAYRVEDGELVQPRRHKVVCFDLDSNPLTPAEVAVVVAEVEAKCGVRVRDAYCRSGKSYAFGYHAYLSVTI